MTTNRIRTLDFAVQSRINLAFKFDDLDNEQKKKIYMNFIKSLNSDSAEKSRLEKWIDDEDSQEEYNFKSLNGRQIRNVLFSAATLGDSQKLTLKNVKEILKHTISFNKDIESLMQNARKENIVG